MPYVRARENRCPLWARVAPVLYLLACAAAVRALLRDPSADVGVAGLLAAIGLVPAFVIPCVFSTRAVRLSANADGLFVDGARVAIDDVRLQHAERGQARIHVDERGGRVRTFLVASWNEAQGLVHNLPPASAPSLALLA